MKDPQKEEIVIDLSKSSNAQIYEKNNRIHVRERKLIDKKVSERLDRLTHLENGQCSDSNSPQGNISRLNDAISILGSRGSGKTSFMMSVLEDYSKHDDIQSLPIIDPTLIEEKGHIFLVVIALIQECVQHKLDVLDCDPHSKKSHKKAAWKELMRKLAAGLPTLDGVAGYTLNESSWQDPEFVMDKGLKAVKAAYDLESNFNKILAFALEILGKKAFMLALDDIDVDFKKGWPVLESLRKYLSSSRLIVLVSGDLQLFSKAIRKQQWKNFGKALLKNEAESFYNSDQDAKDKKRVLGELVTEMEGQYLQKVLKPENRIHLTTLNDKLELYATNICIRDAENNELEVKDFYNTALKQLGIFNEYQAEAYRSHLLTLPIRTQIQFMKVFENKNDMDFTSPFLSDLYEEEVDIQLATNLPKMLNVVILKLLLKERNLDEAYQLQPTTSKLSLNNSLFALSALFSKHVQKNPFLIFDYLIKVGYIRNLLTVLDYHEVTDSTYSKPTVEGLCRFSGILQDKVLRNVVGNINAYIKSIQIYRSNTNKSESKNRDVIELYGSAIKDKKSNKDAKNRIDYVFSSKTEELKYQDQTLAFIPISTSSYLHSNISSTVYSIYTLIATIGELIRKYELNNLDNGFVELSQWRTFPMIAFDKGFSSLSNMEEYPGVEIITGDDGNSIIKELFADWCKNYKEHKVGICSPHLLGKFATRIYYSINSIADKKDSNKNLGIAMHRRIIALMNAILVEDVREHSIKSNKLNISNAITSDNVFLENIKSALKIQDESKTNLSISKWLLSCPLFLAYIDKIIIVNSNFIEFTGIDKIEEIKKANIYDLLSNVEPKNQEVNNDPDLPIFSNSIETINLLIANKIQYSIFKSTEYKNSKESNLIRNNSIRNSCKGVFNIKLMKSGPINKFIKYIDLEDKKVKSLVERWKQVQY